MTTTTLPHVAGLPFGDGRPWYAAHSTISTPLGDENDVLWLPEPVLPDWVQRWATDDEVDTPHLTLNPTTVAELLFAVPAGNDDLLFAAPADDDEAALTAWCGELARLVFEQIARWRCNLSEPIKAVARFAWDCPDLAAARMRQCAALAARLTGTAW